MFQVLGWSKVLTSTYEEVDEFVDESPFGWLQRRLDALKPGLGNRSELAGTNGSWFYRIMLLANHENGYFDEIHELLVELGQRAPGTYGLFHCIYFGLEPEFRCIVIRRGVVKIVADPFFSPIVPTIEDP